MKIAIVGASKLTENEERDARQFCGLMMNQWKSEYDDLEIISGGAKGVDTIAIEVAEGLGISTHKIPPDVEEWNDVDDMIGYRSRNIKIAEECDKLYCLPANFRSESCYHCGTDEHERSGGCWTANRTRQMGKEVMVIPPTNRS